MLTDLIIWCVCYKILDEIILEAIIRKVGEYFGKMSTLKSPLTKKG